MEDRGFDLEARLDGLEDEARRTLTPADRIGARGYFADPVSGELPVLDGEERVVFASTNYLGLTADDRVENAARQAAATVGTGVGASRIATGDTMIHHDVERLLAETTGTDRTLVFGSRYVATLGTITALEPDALFFDQGSHLSGCDGAQLAGCEAIGYNHCDVASLREKLERQADRGDPDDSWLIVTDSVFETDGRVAPLADICDLADRYGAWVMVDESHAIGLYANGGGVIQAEGLQARVDVQVGTLASALASQGGYVAGDDTLIEWLVSRSRQFTHAAGLAPPAAAAASEALHLARHTNVRDRLWDNVAHLRDGLESIGFAICGDSQLLAVAIREDVDTVAVVAALYDRGIVVSGSQSDNRIRLTPMATHSSEEIVTCLQTLQSVGKTYDLF